MNSGYLGELYTTKIESFLTPVRGAHHWPATLTYSPEEATSPSQKKM